MTTSRLVGGIVRWFCGVVALVLLVSCARRYEGTPFVGPNGQGVLYDSTVSSEYQQRLQEDLNYISSLTNLPEVTKDHELMGISNFSGPSLSAWLGQRIQFVAGESYDYEQNQTSTYNQNAYPSVVFSDVSDYEQQLEAVTIMSNIGAASYLDGKSKYSINELSIAGTKITVTSPRIGIFKIGPGLFGTNNQPSGAGLDSIAAVLSRLATIFHEARHDDGNGSHTAFTHAKCPEDHDLEGYYACDQRTNGPYPIEALLLWKFYVTCSNCSNTEKAFLLSRFNDDNNRLLWGATYADPNPERIR